MLKEYDQRLCPEGSLRTTKEPCGVIINHTNRGLIFRYAKRRDNWSWRIINIAGSFLPNPTDSGIYIIVRPRWQ
uniref:Uncharacterized protein n=1 Tax=Rhizoctonia solani TaxID=456999 RepID=N0ACT7_9AGAM|nr:hypothetical protein RSOL_m00780 [Rhizoctonia solani]AGK45404.1 hypothetical protein RSOL_m00780 [Rhizoctonia solani]